MFSALFSQTVKSYAQNGFRLVPNTDQYVRFTQSFQAYLFLHVFLENNLDNHNTDRRFKRSRATEHIKICLKIFTKFKFEIIQVVISYNTGHNVLLLYIVCRFFFYIGPTAKHMHIIKLRSHKWSYVLLLVVEGRILMKILRSRHASASYDF